MLTKEQILHAENLRPGKNTSKAELANLEWVNFLKQKSRDEQFVKDFLNPDRSENVYYGKK